MVLAKHRMTARTVCSSLIIATLAISMVVPVRTTLAHATESTSSSELGAVVEKGLGLDSVSTSGGGDKVGLLSAHHAADAVTLPASPVSGSLAQDESALYRVELAVGERLELTLRAPSPSLPATAAVFDLFLYAPGLADVATATAIAHKSEGPYPRRITLDVSAGTAGTYYIEVNAWLGAGDFTLEWRVLSAGENIRQDVGAAVELALPATRSLTLADTWGANEVYSFGLTAGTRVEIDLAGPADADFDIYLYGPGTGTILPVGTQTVAHSNTPRANESIIFDVPAGKAGTYILEVHRFRGTGTANLTVRTRPIPSAPTATRVWGANRFATAANISRASFPAGSATAVLASGMAFPDGLAASSLAGALRVPILLTEPNRLSAATAAELRRLGVRKVYIIGGTAAIQPAVVSAITALRPAPNRVTPQRIAGANRYATAAEVARETRRITGRAPKRLFLASGENFPDALALSPVAFSMATPILLTSSGALPPATQRVITELRGTGRMDVFVAGGTRAVSAAAARTAKNRAGGVLTRLAGANRYATALAVAEHAVVQQWADAQTLAVASGVAFPDALAGAPLPGMRGGTMLLTHPRALSVPVSDYLRSFDFRVNESWVLGGTGAVQAPVLSRIRTILPDTPLKH